MRSAKETGCFPYDSKLVCFLEVAQNGETRQISNAREKLIALKNARSGESKIYAAWPGQWRTDLFIIDDFDAFEESALKDFK